MVLKSSIAGAMMGSGPRLLQKTGNAVKLIQTAKEREETFKKVSAEMVDKLYRFKLPITKVPAGTIVFRGIESGYTDPKGKNNWRPDYYGLMSLRDGGSRSTQVRWSGMRHNGYEGGCSGSYWGSLHGVTAELFFYHVMKGYKPSAGTIQLLASWSPLLVRGINQQLPNMEGVPSSIPFSGSCFLDVVVARTIRDIAFVDMHPDSSEFLEWNHNMSRALRPILDDLGYKSVADALRDPEFLQVAQAVGNCAADAGHPGIFSKSARSEATLSGYDPAQANNMTFVGPDRKSLAGELVATSVISIRPGESGSVEATVKGIDSAYPSSVERGLVVHQSSASSNSILNSVSESLDGPEGNPTNRE